MSPKIHVGESSIVEGGRGIFAHSPLEREEVVMVMGGRIVDIETHNQIGEFAEEYGMDISEEFSFCPSSDEELELMPQCLLNHSCEPNAGFLDQLQIVAIRGIEPGEEILYDYAFLLFGNPNNQFSFRIDCRCGTDACREVITVNDWKIEALQKQYGPWFQPFLRAKFDRSGDPS